MDAPLLARLLAPWVGSGPAYRAIAAGVRGMVLDGRLVAGTRLPPERALAAALGVSRITVTAAYDELRAEGWAESKAKAGTRVTLPAPPPRPPEHDPAPRGDVWDLTVAALAAPRALTGAVEAAAVDLRPHALHHGMHALGLPELRDAVARHLTSRGLPTVADEVLVTNGALHAWGLVLAALARPGDRALIEQPTYPAVLDATAARRVRVVPMAVGPDLDGRGWVVPDGAGGRLAHVCPDGQNPTGHLADDDARRELLAALRAQGVEHVVCDETFADLVLDGSRPTPLAAIDHDVITIGSLSKAFWAGLRIGWVRAGRATLERIAAARAAADLASPVLEQLVAVRLLADADAVLAERRELLVRNRDALVDAITTGLPWDCTPPPAGMALWCSLGSPGSTALAAAALELGLRLAPGSRFTVDGSADNRLRLPLSVPVARAPELAGRLHEAYMRAVRARLERRPLTVAPRWTA